MTDEYQAYLAHEQHVQEIYEKAIREAKFDSFTRGFQRAIDAIRDRKLWAQYCAEKLVAEGYQSIDIRQQYEVAKFLEWIGPTSDDNNTR